MTLSTSLTYKFTGTFTDNLPKNFGANFHDTQHVWNIFTNFAHRISFFYKS